MAKCSTCNGCFEPCWYWGNIYYFCFLCKRLFKVEGTKLVELYDEELFNTIVKIRGKTA